MRPGRSCPPELRPPVAFVDHPPSVCTSGGMVAADTLPDGSLCGGPRDWARGPPHSPAMSPRPRPERLSAWVTRFRLWVRCVLCLSAFPLAPALGSTASATGSPALFGGFTATMAESDFSESCIGGYGSSPSHRGPSAQ